MNPLPDVSVRNAYALKLNPEGSMSQRYESMVRAPPSRSALPARPPRREARACQVQFAITSNPRHAFVNQLLTTDDCQDYVDNMNRKTISPSAALIAAVVLGIAGIAVFLLAIGFEWGGFGGGMAMGAGIGLALAATFFWGYATGLRAPGIRAQWRPSDDPTA